MKKLLLLSLFVFFIAQSFGAASADTKPIMAKDIILPVGSTGKTITILDLATISAKDFEELSGKKMKWAQKMAFKSGQRKLRNKINDDGSISSKVIEKAYKKSATAEGGDFNIGGFALGFLLGLIGVLIAYVIGGDNVKNRTKWAWIGCAIWVGISLLVLIF